MPFNNLKSYPLKVERLNGAFSKANKETIDVIKEKDSIISKSKELEKRNIQEIVNHILEIEHLKEELNQEKHHSKRLEMAIYKGHFFQKMCLCTGSFGTLLIATMQVCELIFMMKELRSTVFH